MGVAVEGGGRAKIRSEGAGARLLRDRVREESMCIHRQADSTKKTERVPIIEDPQDSRLNKRTKPTKYSRVACVMSLCSSTCTLL